MIRRDVPRDLNAQRHAGMCCHVLLAAALVAVFATPRARADDANRVHAAVLDFTSADGKAGATLADGLRLKLRRQDRWQVVDRLTTQELAGPTGQDANRAAVAQLMTRRLGVHVCVYGSVTKVGDAMRASAVCLDLRGQGPPAREMVFADDTERWRAAVATKIVQWVVGGELWRPPEYGDEDEPDGKALGRPLNRNGGFENGHAGWDAPDRVSTFLVEGPKQRGTILRVRTDLKRDPWLAYRRALRLGQADPNRPPEIARDTSFGCVGGLEGVHYRSEWIPATPGRRYWLLADHKGPGGAKVFVKGFAEAPPAERIDGLPESALAELGLTPREFADLPPARRRELIADDAENHPQRHRREAYRWYLNCKDSRGAWTHFAAPFPPRGGLGANVKWLQIQIYSYWPPGTYLWDDVHLYADPRQTDPLPEQKPRTPSFRRDDARPGLRRDEAAPAGEHPPDRPNGRREN